MGRARCQLLLPGAASVVVSDGQLGGAELFLASNGFCRNAHNRRGHGHSSQPLQHRNVN